MIRRSPREDARRLEMVEGLERAKGLGAATQGFVELAAKLTRVPFAAVSLLSAGEQLFVSVVGAPPSATRSRALAVCSRAVRSAQAVVVGDTSTDPELRDDPTGKKLDVAACASFPLVTHDGFVVGTLVALDRVPRTFSPMDLEVLSVLASAITAQVDLERMRASSVYDDLSGLMNRQGFMMLGEHYLKIARRREAAVVLFFVVIERLDEIEKGHGRDAADLAISDTARVLVDLAREADFVARISDDKFAILAVDAEVGTGPLLEDRLNDAVLRLNATPGRTHDLVLFGSHLVIVTRRSDDDEFSALVDEGLTMLLSRTGTIARIVSGPPPI